MNGRLDGLFDVTFIAEVFDALTASVVVVGKGLAVVMVNVFGGEVVDGVGVVVVVVVVLVEVLVGGVFVPRLPII